MMLKLLRNYLHKILFYYYVKALHTFMIHDGLLHSIPDWTQCFSQSLQCYSQSWCCFKSMYLDWTCTPADITWHTYGLCVILTWKVLRNKTCYTWICEHCMNYIHFNMWTLHDMSAWWLFISLYILHNA